MPMEYTDEAFVLSARPHGETGALVDLLTSVRGRWAAHVAGGASRKMKPHLQAGARVLVSYRARTSDNLGSATLEPIGEGPSALFDDRLALAGLNAACAVAAGALPEREPHPGAYAALEALVDAFSISAIWPAVYVRFEAGLLQAVGFELDFSTCAATGSSDDLVWVSPRTGRAVSRAAGAAYADKLLPLPPFLVAAQNGVQAGDVGQGLSLTGYFLERFVFAPLNKPLPPPRVWLAERLSEAGRL